MENLIIMLDYFLKACERATDTRTRRTFFDQATGAMQMYCLLNLDEEHQVFVLWDTTYYPKFDKLVYGV